MLMSDRLSILERPTRLSWWSTQNIERVGKRCWDFLMNANAFSNGAWHYIQQIDHRLQEEQGWNISLCSISDRPVKMDGTIWWLLENAKNSWSKRSLDISKENFMPRASLAFPQLIRCSYYLKYNAMIV